MSDQIGNIEVSVSPTAQDIRSKDTAYQAHVYNVRKWETAKELDQKMSTNTAGEKPKPDQAAARGEEFATMRSEIKKEFNDQRHKVDFKKPNSFDKLPSKIAKTENPTDKIVKMSTYLDLLSDFLPEVSIPRAVDALDKCPEALEVTSKFKDSMVNTVRNIQPNFIRNNAELVDKISATVLPFADVEKHSEIVEVTGEVVGAQLYQAIIDSPNRSISYGEVKTVLQQKGITVSQNESVQDGSQLDYNKLQNLLVDEAIKMDTGDMKDKALGVSLGMMCQVVEGLPIGRTNRENEPRLLEIMKSVFDTSDKITKEAFPSSTYFVQQKVSQLKGDMQMKRNTWS